MPANNTLEADSTGSLSEEELDTGTDETLEASPEDESTTDDEAVDEDAETLEAGEDATDASDGDFISKPHRGDERIADVTARMSRIEQMLNQFAQQQAQPVQPATQPTRPDRYAANPNTKQWADFITEVGNEKLMPEVQRQVQALLTPVQQQVLVAQETVDDMNARRKFTDYDKFEGTINDLRAQWYRDGRGIVPREYAYYVAKGQQGERRATAERTQAARKAAKPGAKPVATKTNAKAKIKPPLTLDSIANMSHDQITKLADDMKLSW